jgi:hypothetical protein
MYNQRCSSKRFIEGFTNKSKLIYLFLLDNVDEHKKTRRMKMTNNINRITGTQRAREKNLCFFRYLHKHTGT